MSFNFIIEPATLESYSIFSKEGAALLKKYVKDYQTGGALTPEDEESEEGLISEDEPSVESESDDHEDGLNQHEVTLQTIRNLVCNNNDEEGEMIAPQGEMNDPQGEMIDPKERH